MQYKLTFSFEVVGHYGLQYPALSLRLDRENT